MQIREVNEVGQSLVKAASTLADANAALKSNEARLHGIVEAAMDVIITVDDRQVIVMFSTAAWAMFTCTAEQAIGLSMTRFIPERLHAQYLAYVENRRVRGDGSEVLDAVGIVIGLRLNGVEFPPGTFLLQCD